MNLFELLAQNEIRTFYELVPMVPLSQWWHLLIALVVGIGLIGYIVMMYRADSVELPTGLTFLLTTLRVLAFVGLVIFILNPEKRSETRVVKTSRVSVLVDTSLSMGLRDPGPTGEPQPQRRIDDVVSTIANTELLDRLRQEHDVNVYRFDEQPQPELLASLEKVENEEEPQDRKAQLVAQSKQDLERSHFLGRIGLGLLVLSLVLGVIYYLARIRDPEQKFASWLLAASSLTLLASVVFVGMAHTGASEYDLMTSLGLAQGEPQINVVETRSEEEGDKVETEKLPDNWGKALNPTGTATRLSRAVEFIANKERGGPIAGLILITDGRDNEGTSAARAVATCADSNIPVYTVGIGSDKQPQNVRVDDLQAPPRVFPNDKFKISGLIKSVGMAGQTVAIKLISQDEKGQEAEMIEAEDSIRLGADGQHATIEFELSRQEEGKRRYTLKIEGVKQDLDPRDNERSALVEVIEKKTRVLLMAGGPTREFRFLRNQLYRDEDVTLSVWLQSAQAGADQESDELLDDFPADRESMFEFDCVIAFDPDWRKLTVPQAKLLEKWVAEQAGGMIVIAGPVFTPEWTRRARGDEAIDLVRRLYPVSFYSQASPTLKLGRFGGETAFPIQFTREGRASRQLWLGPTSAESQETWDSFEGIYGYYAVNEQKAGADVLARFSDPDTVINDELPIYMATQFYGSGRVYYQGSGEMWRVRNFDVAYFQDFYTQLIRWASQGRLLRDSTRGVLLSEKQQCWVGDQVVIQAMLRNAQDEPLVAETVSAVLLKPDGSTETLELKAAKDSVRAGTFSAQFTALADGEYRVSLPVPESPEGDILTTTIEAKIPDLEKARPQRNDALLQQFADKTNGKYFVGVEKLNDNPSDPESLYSLVAPQDQITFLPGTPNREFARRTMIWLLTFVVIALAMEWTIRRLHKLA